MDEGGLGLNMKRANTINLKINSRYMEKKIKSLFVNRQILFVYLEIPVFVCNALNNASELLKRRAHDIFAQKERRVRARAQLLNAHGSRNENRQHAFAEIKKNLKRNSRSMEIQHVRDI